MAFPTSLQPRPHQAGLEGWCACLSLSLLLLPAGARAQSAEVVRPDARGEFTRTRISGARGTVPQRFWLVVDPDPRGLLCRDAGGRAQIALRAGSVVELAVPEQQPAALPLLSKPTLLVAVKPVDILVDARLQNRGQAAVCRVRANSAFIAPIQMDSLERVLIRP